MSQKLTYVILPAGTAVREGGYESALSFVLECPTMALVLNVWDKNFEVEPLSDRNGEAIKTELRWNFVRTKIGEFAGGQTSGEAWLNFDRK